MRYLITPVPKPRQTKSDVWKKRPCVMRYRAFADEVRAAGIEIGAMLNVKFYLPMPSSWSGKKKMKMAMEPHQQTPDLDNLVKALLDAVLSNDAHVYSITAVKTWGHVGSIVIED